MATEAKDEFDWMDEAAPLKAPEPLDPEVYDAVAKVPKKLRNRRSAALVRAERKLSIPQRKLARYLEEFTTIKQATDQLESEGYSFDRGTFWRWRQTPDFINYQNELRTQMLESLGISKAKVLLDAEKIKQLALTPTDILHKGEATGYTEVNLGAALRATELQGKGVGIGDEEGHRVVVSLDIDFSGRVDKPAIEGEFEDA